MTKAGDYTGQCSIPAEKSLQRRMVLLPGHVSGPVPADVHARVGPLLARGGPERGPRHAGRLRPVQAVLRAADGLQALELAPPSMLLVADADLGAGDLRKKEYICFQKM